MTPISKASIACLALLGLCAAGPATTETIVMLRHGEKPDLGLGQLNCQGLNRALALPAVLRQFGRPDAIFAPDPGETKEDRGQDYAYVRPLATIEPTAIALGLPVQAGIGVSHTKDLQRALEAPAYRGALVLVAWEHTEAAKLAKALVEDHGGDGKTVPHWDRNDFDSLYVVRITRTDGKSSATFERRAQGLNGQSTACPGPAPRG